MNLHDSPWSQAPSSRNLYLVADLRGLRGPVGDRLAFGVLEAALLAVAAVAIVAERAADLRHGGAVDNCC